MSRTYWPTSSRRSRDSREPISRGFSVTFAGLVPYGLEHDYLETTMTRIVLTDISPTAWEHPADRVAAKAALGKLTDVVGRAKGACDDAFRGAAR